jgi:hypothetical protein
MKKLFLTKCIYIILIAVLFSTVSSSHVQAEAAETISKKFTYYIFWSGIRAGKAVLEYKSTPEGTTIKTHATSASFLSLFYKVDDTAQSTLYPDGYPREYILKVREGFHRRHKVTRFNRNKDNGLHQVIYHNVLDNELIKLNLDKPVFDPLSAFHEMTMRNLMVGQSEFIDVFDNKKLWHTEIKILKKERMKVIAGEFDTIVVKPLLKSEGLFRKTGEMHLWITDDERKLPVLFTSKAVIGKFSVVLAEGDF